MRFIGVDVGYFDNTTIVIVDTDKNVRFKFETMEAASEFDDVFGSVVELMRRYKVRPDNVSFPGHPAAEHKLKQLFGKNPSFD